MEKQSNRSKEFKVIHTFDRIFTKARGVHLLPEEKSDILAMIEKTPLEAEPIPVTEEKAVLKH